MFVRLKMASSGFASPYLIARRSSRTLELGTRIWIGRQLVFTQLKFAILVCFLSTHINVVVQVGTGVYVPANDADPFSVFNYCKKIEAIIKLTARLKFSFLNNGKKVGTVGFWEK